MSSPFHEGELAVQERAGVSEQAQKVGRIIHAHLPDGAGGFLANLPILFRGGLDHDGDVWASALTGNPGFISAQDARTVTVDANPLPDDPLAVSSPAEAPAGFLAINLANRQRFRFNGRASRRDETLYIQIDQAYGNCPKYIQRREVVVHDRFPDVAPASTDTALSNADIQLIRRADTFFIATHAKDRGVDVSHRGGVPGFVRVARGGSLTFNDYPGNNMFQTLGNLATDPRAGLLFIDFDTGDTLQLTGRAETHWTSGSTAEFNQTGRSVTFAPQKIIRTPHAVPLRWVLKEYSPYNPEEKSA